MDPEDVFEDVKQKFQWMRDIPDEFKSRKLFLVFATMCLLFLMAFVGTITAHFFGFNEGLWRDAMLYISGIGGTGTVAQTVPDALQARNGTYRQGYYNNTEKVTGNILAPSAPIIPISSAPEIEDVVEPIIDFPAKPVEVKTRTSFIDKL